MKDGGRELQLETYRLQSVKSFLKNEKQLDINASQENNIRDLDDSSFQDRQA